MTDANDNMKMYMGVMKAISTSSGVADNRLTESLNETREIDGFVLESLGSGITKTEIIQMLNEEGVDQMKIKQIAPRIDAMASVGLDAAEARLAEGNLITDADYRLAALYDVMLEDGLSEDEVMALFAEAFTEETEFEFDDEDDGETLAEGGKGSGRRKKNDVYGKDMLSRYAPGSRGHIEAHVRSMSVPKARTPEKRGAHVKAIRLLMGGRNSMAEIIRKTGLHGSEVHKHRANIAKAENSLAGYTGHKDHLHDIAGERVARTMRGEKRRANSDKKARAALKEDYNGEETLDELSDGMLGRYRSASVKSASNMADNHPKFNNRAGGIKLARAKMGGGARVSSSNRTSSLNSAWAAKSKTMGESEILDEIEYLLDEGFTEAEIEMIIVDNFSMDEISEAAENLDEGMMGAGVRRLGQVGRKLAGPAVAAAGVAGAHHLSTKYGLHLGGGGLAMAGAGAGIHLNNALGGRAAASRDRLRNKVGGMKPMTNKPMGA